ncbi:MAG: class I SAM-dependent methyltransferase [Bacteroidetes bacterium]|nr:class I SAM-dependent methyltransferase [Bacteroidota bacterium]
MNSTESHSGFTGERIIRKEPCRICGSVEGKKIAETEFWNLQHSDIVECTSCRLIQLDPMITEANTATGCHAYFLREIHEIPVHEQKRNLVRNYRRGIVFGRSLQKKGVHPENILEFGPGSGYFSAGIRFIFPGCRITVVDIVDEVLNRIHENHGFEVFRGSPEDIHMLGNRKFDLVIARDILEHVTDIGKVTRNIVTLLSPEGLFHFITPNGKEDVWGHYLNWKFRRRPSELLLNHVNYFEGSGLLDFLLASGFTNVEYYTYQVKYTFRGKGWRMKEKLATPVSIGLNAEELIRTEEQKKPADAFRKDEILDSFIFRTKNTRIISRYCWLKHHWLIRLDPARNTGHEIHGLFKMGVRF